MSKKGVLRDPISTEYDLCHFIYMYGWITIAGLAEHLDRSEEAVGRMMYRVLPKAEARGVKVHRRDRITTYRQWKGGIKIEKEFAIWDPGWRRFYDGL